MNLELKLTLVRERIQQRELAAFMGVSPAAVNRWVNGSRSLPPERQSQIDLFLQLERWNREGGGSGDEVSRPASSV